MPKLGLVAAVAASLCAPQMAHAFCGFYAAASDAPMFNDATQVVLMRKGSRTVVSMRNNYKGPPDAFAMVIPVPAVLQERDVKILTPEVFDVVEQMGSPRLVEYWEQDPCKREPAVGEGVKLAKPSAAPVETTANTDRDLGVTIESQFAAGEYQIVILSAKDAAGLDSWLRREKYQLPSGAEPLLRPYVESGMKFFVAKVDPTKVQFDNDRAVLSPLRFHYDSEQFNLPIRLGLANSSGTQDLIVNILAPQQRYEVANYPNVTIPTNITVRKDVQGKFGAFYVSLFDATVQKHPDAVITEYAWDAKTCDPCPGPTLQPAHFQALGADVIEGADGFVLTRLHARYDKSIKDDLQFKPAPPIAGGREHFVASGKLEEGAQPSPYNNFQARYAIRHAWNGAITCENPVRGRWGTNPGGVKPALDLAFAPRGSVELKTAVTHDVPELGLEILESALKMAPVTAPAVGPEKKKIGCGCGATDTSGGVAFGALLLLLRRRKR